MIGKLLEKDYVEANEVEAREGGGGGGAESKVLFPRLGFIG